MCHECHKPGYLRRDCSVYKKLVAEKVASGEGWWSKCVRRTMSLRFDEQAVIPTVQSPETHICID